MTKVLQKYKKTEVSKNLVIILLEYLKEISIADKSVCWSGGKDDEILVNIKIGDL